MGIMKNLVVRPAGRFNEIRRAARFSLRYVTGSGSGRIRGDGVITITLTIPPETQRKLVEWATRVGRDVESLACELIERSLDSDPTLDDILAPFRRQVAESGMSESELAALFEESRDEVYRDKQEAGR